MSDPVDPNQPEPYPEPANAPYTPPPVTQPPPAYSPYVPPQSPYVPPQSPYVPPQPPYVPQYGYPQSWDSPASHTWSAESTPPTPPWEELPRRRRIVVPAVVVIALLIVGAVVWGSVSGNGSSADRIVAPAQLGDYELVHSGAAQRMTDMMHSALSGDHEFKSVISKATIAAYAHNTGDQPTLILLAFRTSQVGGQGSPLDALSGQLTAIAGSAALVTIPPGPHGGQIGCGAIPVGIHSEIICAWGDSYSTGILEAIDSAETATQFGQTVLQLQDLIDH